MKIQNILRSVHYKGKWKKISITMLFFAAFVFNMGFGGHSVTAVTQTSDLNSSSSVQQAYPTFDHYWFMNIFTGNGVNETIPSDWAEDMNIDFKMDEWSHLGNGSDASDDHFFQLYNFTDRFNGTLKYLDIFADSWISTIIPAPWNYHEVNGTDIEQLPGGHLQLTGGYYVDAYNKNYYFVNSNITLVGSPAAENLSFNTLMQRNFNISSNLLLSRDNLTAEILNGSQMIPCDNPLYFNISTLQQIPIGGDYMLNGLQYVMIVKNTTFYQLFNENRNYTLTIKPDGELWCITIGHTFTTPMFDNQFDGEPHMTWDKVEIWFGWEHYVNHHYFDTKTPIIIPLAIGAAVAAVIAGSSVITVKLIKKKKKLGRDPQSEPKLKNSKENEKKNI